MITEKHGCIFKTRKKTIAIPVNCVGIMGKGLALQAKIFYPHMFLLYEKLCKNKQIKPGTIFLYEIIEKMKKTNCKAKQLICFPTKNHWMNDATMENITLGLNTLEKFFHDMEIESLALPKLGCGLGKLDYKKQVKPVIIEKLKHFEVEIYA